MVPAECTFLPVSAPRLLSRVPAASRVSLTKQGALQRPLTR